MEIKDILVINPGSTTTKIAVYTNQNKDVLFEETIVHDENKILSFPNVASQREYRRDMILQMLQEDGYDLSNLSAVVGRGGMVYDLAGGGYKVNKKTL